MDFGCVTAVGAVVLPPIIYIAKLLPVFEFFGNSGKNIEKGKKM